MSRRLSWGLALAAACLLGAGVARWRRSAPAERRPLSNLAPEALVRVERRLNGDTLVLSRKAGVWSAQGLGPADPALCEGLARGAQSLSLGPKVTADPGSYDEYGLSDAQAARLRVFAEGSEEPALTAYFGKRAYGDALYARLADEAPVYVATGVAPDVLLRPATGFLLKR